MTHSSLTLRYQSESQIHKQEQETETITVHVYVHVHMYRRSAKIEVKEVNLILSTQYGPLQPKNREVEKSLQVSSYIVCTVISKYSSRTDS